MIWCGNSISPYGPLPHGFRDCFAPHRLPRPTSLAWIRKRSTRPPLPQRHLHSIGDQQTHRQLREKKFPQDANPMCYVIGAVSFPCRAVTGSTAFLPAWSLLPSASSFLGTIG